MKRKRARNPLCQRSLQPQWMGPNCWGAVTSRQSLRAPLPLTPKTASALMTPQLAVRVEVLRQPVENKSALRDQPRCVMVLHMIKVAHRAYYIFR